jgi:N-acetylglucosamine kinase-like BadF-type ATPase
MPSQYYVLGVDAGGSKTSAWVASYQPGPGSLAESTHVLAVGEAGTGNCRSAGFERAMQNIQRAVKLALTQAGLPPDNRSRSAVDSICLGMAGAGRREEQQQVERWIARHLHINRIRVVGDAPLALAAACGELSPECVLQMEGVALISGTGSMAWGCNLAGQEHRCGGWGYLLGDEGSGYWLARHGLQAACRAADGRASPTLLLPAFLQNLELPQASDLIGKVYTAAFDRQQIARLAPLVIQLAQTDATAGSIVRQAARELAEMVSVIVAKLSLSSSHYTLALGGSVLANSPLLSQWIVDSLNQSGPRPAAKTVDKPVLGAVYLAASHCG